jgi:NAD(P)H dehydrogenase (quinone)
LQAVLIETGSSPPTTTEFVMSKTTTLFVTGASGHLGRHAVELLLARKDPTLKIIAGSRTPEKLAGLDGVEVRRVDFEQPSTLATAFAGVDRLLLVSTDALAGC